MGVGRYCQAWRRLGLSVEVARASGILGADREQESLPTAAAALKLIGVTKEVIQGWGGDLGVERLISG